MTGFPLPDELMISTISFLSEPDLLALLQVCRQTRRLVLDQSIKPKIVDFLHKRASGSDIQRFGRLFDVSLQIASSARYYHLERQLNITLDVPNCHSGLYTPLYHTFFDVREPEIRQLALSRLTTEATPQQIFNMIESYIITFGWMGRSKGNCGFNGDYIHAYQKNFVLNEEYHLEGLKVLLKTFKIPYQTFDILFRTCWSGTPPPIVVTLMEHRKPGPRTYEKLYFNVTRWNPSPYQYITEYKRLL